MSVRTMAAVWEGSMHSGSALLMMLAIADFSDDKGTAYPAVATLAAKTRMQTRNANYLLRELQASGELIVRLGQGPKGTNLYRIALDRLQGLQHGAGVQAVAGVKRSAGVQADAGLQPSARGAALQCSKPLHPSADEPSLNRQEPSDTSLARPNRVPTCPFEQIVAAYHDALPELPRVKLIDAKGRRKRLSDFWAWVFTSKRSDGTSRAKSADEAMAWIREYFGRASRNDFVMGRTPRSKGHEGWEAGLDFLLREEGRIQVIERTREAA